MIVTLRPGVLQSVLFRLLSRVILFVATGSDMILRCVIGQQGDAVSESAADDVDSPMGSRERKKKASIPSYIWQVNVHHCHQ
jgi:hypothetical protein